MAEACWVLGCGGCSLCIFCWRRFKVEITKVHSYKLHSQNILLVFPPNGGQFLYLLNLSITIMLALISQILEEVIQQEFELLVIGVCSLLIFFRTLGYHREEHGIAYEGWESLPVLRDIWVRSCELPSPTKASKSWWAISCLSSGFYYFDETPWKQVGKKRAYTSTL